MFSDLIKERRKELGWTQQDFADKIFVTRQTISNWENEKNFPDIPTLIQISNQLDLSLDYLLKGDVKYMKKVETDYTLIKKEKKARKLGRVVAGLTIAIMLITLIGVVLINKHLFTEKWLSVAVLTLGIPYQVTSYCLYTTHFNSDTNMPQPLWIPKAYGIGLAINPNTLIGKLVWFVLFVFLLGLWFYALIFL